MVLLRDAYGVPANGGALSALNVAFIPGQVQLGRLGFGQAPTTSGPINLTSAATSLVNWRFVAVGAEVSVLAMYQPSAGVSVYNLTVPSGVVTEIAQTGAAGASLSPTNERLYAAFYSSSMLGYAGGQVYGWDVGADPLFASPVNFSPVGSQTGSGVVTAGTHRLAFLLTTRNGYTTMLCPATGPGGFNPGSFTSTGSHNLAVTITPSGSWPSYASSIQLVMTTTSNLDQYYTVPGATVNVGGSVPASITVNLDDADLAATGLDATPYLSLLCSSGGTPPFSPYKIFQYSSRMGYLTLDPYGFPSIYFSDPNNFQYITADQHAVYLDGQDRAITGDTLRGICYLLTKTRTFAVADNGGVPATWAPPSLVSSVVGTPSPNGFCVNSAEGYAWTASLNGLYFFQGGVYPVMPASYFQTPDWLRINWTDPTKVSVVDDPVNRVVKVFAPLNASGSSPAGNYIMSWNYTRGFDAESLDYSRDSFGDEQSAAYYGTGAAGLVLNQSNGQNEVWVTPNAAGYVLRQNNGTETNPYRDTTFSGSAHSISFTYNTGLIPGPVNQSNSTWLPSSPTVNRFYGAHFRLRSNLAAPSTIALAAQALDGTVSVVPAASPLSVSATPAQEQLVKWILLTEQQSISFSGNTVDNGAILSLIRAYFKPAMSMRTA